jgi:hypothetical protein
MAPSEAYLVVYVKATLFDCSFHTVDSSEVSFEITGSHALSDGLKMASPALLEPVMRAAISIPESDAGDVMGDLNGRRAKILGMMPDDNDITLIDAEVPQAEMLHCATELRSQTQGRGTFTMVFDHYDQVPAHLVHGISISKTGKRRRLPRCNRGGGAGPLAYPTPRLNTAVRPLSVGGPDGVVVVAAQDVCDLRFFHPPEISQEPVANVVGRTVS